MKKFLFGALALFIFASCNKDDQTGIPPINGGETPITPTIEVVNASDIDVTYYTENLNKKVAVKGAITVQGTRSYLTLKDNTLIQIYASNAVFNTLSQDAKDKLATNGQEVTVTGTFTDYTNANTGVTIKEIVYTKEGDLVFGNVSQSTITELEASTATVSDYVVGKKVKLHGTITIEGTKSYFKFSDNTMIQIYAPNSVYNALSQENKTKLATEGQEITVTGTFTDYTNTNTNVTIKEIVYSKAEDLVFGTTPAAVTPVDVDSATSNLADVYAEGKSVKVTGTIIYESTRSWIAFNDGEKVQLYIQGFNSLAQDIKDKLAITGQGVIITGKFATYNNTKQLQVQNGATDITFTGTTPTITITDLEATTATVNDYAEGKNVKLHGTITIDGDKAFFKLSDDTLIQIYAPTAVVNTLSQDAKDKLKIEGQELTITGIFTTYNNVKQVVYSKAEDLVFGTTPTNPNPNPNPSTGGGKFDFENTSTATASYNTTETLTNGNATLTYKARTDVAGYAIEGKGLMLKNTEHIKITFKSGIRQLKFAYKGAYTNQTERKVVVYEGDETSTTVLGEQAFAYNASGEYTLDLNKTGEFTITIKGGNTRQIVIDNISWTE